MIAVSDIPVTEDDDVPLSTAALAYRRRARQIRHRFRNDPARLHLSLKSLATQVDAACPASPGAPRLQHVKTRVVPARVVARADTPTSFIARENGESAAMVARQTATIASGLQTSVGLVEEFSDRVRDLLGEGILRYDQRKALYRDAAELGIDRFEASLIIAAIEHRHGLQRNPPSRAKPRPGKPVIAIVSGILILEAIILTIARTLIF